MFLKGFGSFVFKAIILSFSARFGDAGGRLYEALVFEAVQYGIEHTVGPLHFAVGEFADALNYGVAVVFSFGENRQNQGGGGSSD